MYVALTNILGQASLPWGPGDCNADEAAAPLTFDAWRLKQYPPLVSPNLRSTFEDGIALWPELRELATSVSLRCELHEV